MIILYEGDRFTVYGLDLENYPSFKEWQQQNYKGMVQEVTFRYNVQPIKGGDQFEMTFHKVDDNWELANTDVSDYFVDAGCLKYAVANAMDILDEINNVDKDNNN